MITVRITQSWDNLVITHEFSSMEEARSYVAEYYSDCDITYGDELISVYF